MYDKIIPKNSNYKRKTLAQLEKHAKISRQSEKIYKMKRPRIQMKEQIDKA